MCDTLDTTVGGGVYPRLSELDQHCQEYEAWFSAVDDELYRLFGAHSGHADPRSVYVKVTFLICSADCQPSEVDPSRVGRREWCLCA